MSQFKIAPKNNSKAIKFFSSTSGITGLGLGQNLFKSKIGSVENLFHTDAYIEKLKQQLRYELGAVSSYSRLIKGDNHIDVFQELSLSHQKASRELCCLITAHHGLPDKEAAPLFKVADTLLDIYGQLPLGSKLLFLSLGNFEQHMSGRYKPIIAIAPAQDKHTLTELRRLSRKNRRLIYSVLKSQ